MQVQVRARAEVRIRVRARVSLGRQLGLRGARGLLD